jgi:minor histocompatibility antigen H13
LRCDMQYIKNCFALPVSMPVSTSVNQPVDEYSYNSKSKSADKANLFTYGIVGYALGLVMAFGVGYISQHAQPALIYLVPGVLAPVAFRAWQTNRLLEIWNGPISHQ